MTGYIQKINTTIPYTDKKVDIDLQGKNLIITGGNGCGKTNFLNHVFNYLKNKIVNKSNPIIIDFDSQIRNLENVIDLHGKAHPNYPDWVQQLSYSRQQKYDLLNPIVTISNLENYLSNFDSRKALLTTFKAVREANIQGSSSAFSTTVLAGQEKAHSSQQTQPQAATLFEQYLVSYKTLQAYAESPSIDNNPELAEKIKHWFGQLQNSLKSLFEDDTLELKFDSKLQTFLIKQAHKEPYRFQTLSSGYSSILAVYAHLVTTIQLREITPNDVEGVVFIDEIDAHLHVSLQRKIFSFLDESFPNIQFIVSTHSPFVVASVSNAVIYDLSKLEQVEDLSMYSYESILEGLFGVSVSSDELIKKVKELTDEANKPNLDTETLESLISELRKNETKLDSESLYFLESAQLSVLKAKAKSTDV